MFGPSGKLYQPPWFYAKVSERRLARKIAAEAAEALAIAAAMAEQNEDKRKPAHERKSHRV